jgi:hypothetical protein
LRLNKGVVPLWRGATILSWIAGHKFMLHIRQDAYSQTLARFALGAGLGEKTSSIGGGFCILTNH